MSEPLRVCYFGTYRANYNRNQIMIAGLRLNGVEVTECHATLWRGLEDRAQVAQRGWLRPAFWWRVIRTYARLLSQYRQAGDYDVMVVGYPGILDVFLARLLSRLRRKPLVWDVFLSIYEVACERGMQRSSPLSVRLLRWLESAALRMPDLGLLDTPAYANWFRQEYPSLRTPLDYVLIGVDEQLFSPGAPQIAAHTGPCRVLYYGTYLPNHGIPTIIEAIRLLEDEPNIQFEMVGQGIEHTLARSLAEQYGLRNVVFVDWLDKPDLVHKIEQADVLLGAFGNTLHSLATIHNKTYEGLAMGKAVLTGDAPIMRQFFHPGEDVFLCPQVDAPALAQAIRHLCAEPALRQRLGENGQRWVRQQYTTRHIGRSFKEILLRLSQSQRGEK